MLLEANLHYPTGSGFDTIVKNLLGQGWNVINGIALAFVLRILTYAYILRQDHGKSSQPIVQLRAKCGRNWTHFRFLNFLFSAGAFCLVFSTKRSDRFSTVLIAGMVISFILLHHRLSFLR